jgi:hypothetical protein
MRLLGLLPEQQSAETDRRDREHGNCSCLPLHVVIVAAAASPILGTTQVVVIARLHPGSHLPTAATLIATTGEDPGASEPAT